VGRGEGVVDVGVQHRLESVDEMRPGGPFGLELHVLLAVKAGVLEDETVAVREVP